MNGIVDKPQFDSTVFTMGAVVAFKEIGRLAKHGLITSVTPFALEVYFYDSGSDEFISTSILVDDVVNNQIMVQLVKIPDLLEGLT